MNRRDYLKYTGITGLIGLGSFGLYKFKSKEVAFNLESFKAQIPLLGEVVDLIIPETDSPGAKRAGVQHYITKIMLECEDDKERTHFYNGLLNINRKAFSNYEKAFVDCTLSQKQHVISELSSGHSYSYKLYNKIIAKLIGKPFFVRLRELTVEGYCLSEAGATKGLVYDYIPGSYLACMRLQKGQHSWATK